MCRTCSAVTVLVTLVTLVSLAAGAGSPGTAAAAQRSGTSAAGVPIVLEGRAVRITVPKTTRSGRRIVVRCGRLTTVELLAGMGLESATVARGSRVFRSRRRMTLRLSRDVSAIAEWCEFETLPRGHSGAAVLEPPIAPRPAPLVSAPGVRVAITETGGARFLLDGSTLTLRTNAPLPSDVVLTLVCYATDEEEDLRILGGRTVAIGYRRRVVTVDLGHDVEAASDSCLAEDASGGGSDLHFAEFKP